VNLQVQQPLGVNCNIMHRVYQRKSRQTPRINGQKEKGQPCLDDWPLFYAGDDLRSHTLSRAVPSALRGLTSVFGMGTGGSPAVRSPTNLAVSYQPSALSKTVLCQLRPMGGELLKIPRLNTSQLEAFARRLSRAPKSRAFLRGISATIPHN
jgi:hypothetical protein